MNQASNSLFFSFLVHRVSNSLFGALWCIRHRNRHVLHVLLHQGSNSAFCISGVPPNCSAEVICHAINYQATQANSSACTSTRTSTSTRSSISSSIRINT
jgi:hypothetical protein